MNEANCGTLTHGYALEVLDYDAVTGEFVWKRRLGQRIGAGAMAGTKNKDGYRIITINRRLYSAHRLAWLMSYGDWPVGHIDHINGIRDDNALGNLRDVPPALNCQNIRKASPCNKSGVLGANIQRNGTWAAKITLNGKEFHLGTFKTPEAAGAAYVKAKRLMHPGCTI